MTAYRARLTFDDGPSRHTADILEILEHYGVLATFFVIGEKVREHAALIARMAHAGHTIGNHSWDHALSSELSDREIALQLTKTNSAIAAVIGKSPTVFRPPFGDRDERLDTIVARLGMTTMLWDVDCEDWTKPGAEVIAKRVAEARPHEIVLLHDGGVRDRLQTVEGLRLGLARACADTPPAIKDHR